MDRTPPMFSKHREIREAGAGMTYSPKQFGLTGDKQFQHGPEFFADKKEFSPYADQRGEKLPGVKRRPGADLDYELEPQLAEDIEEEEEQRVSSGSGKRDIRKLMQEIMTEITEIRTSTPALGGIPITTPRRSPSPKRPITPPLHYESPPKYHKSPSPSPQKSFTSPLHFETPPEYPTPSPKKSYTPPIHRESPPGRYRSPSPSPQGKDSMSPETRMFKILEQDVQKRTSPGSPAAVPRRSKSPKSQRKSPQAANERLIQQIVQKQYEELMKSPAGGKIITEVVSTTSVSEMVTPGTPPPFDPFAFDEQATPGLPSPLRPPTAVHGWRTPEKLKAKVPTPPSPLTVVQPDEQSGYLHVEDAPEYFTDLSPPRPPSPFDDAENIQSEEIFIIEDVETVEELTSPIRDILEAHEYTDEFRDPQRPAAQRFVLSGSKKVPLSRKSAPPPVSPISEEAELLPYFESPPPIKPFPPKYTSPPKTPPKEYTRSQLPTEEQQFLEHYVPAERQELLRRVSEAIADVEDDSIPYYVPPALPQVSPEFGSQYIIASTEEIFEDLPESPHATPPLDVSPFGEELLPPDLDIAQIAIGTPPRGELLESPDSPYSFEKPTDPIGYEALPEDFAETSPHEPYQLMEIDVEGPPEEFDAVPPTSPQISPGTPPVDYLDLTFNIHAYAAYAPTLSYLTGPRASRKPALSPVGEVPQGYQEEYLPFRQEVARAQSIERRPVRVGKRVLERHSSKPSLTTWTEEIQYTPSPTRRASPRGAAAADPRDKHRRARKMLPRKRLNFDQQTDAHTPDARGRRPEFVTSTPLSPRRPTFEDDLPDMPLPEDLLGSAGPVIYEETITEIEAELPPGLPSPLKAPVTVPGWKTPEKFKVTPKAVSPLQLQPHWSANKSDSLKYMSPPEMYSPEETQYYSPAATPFMSVYGGDETAYFSPKRSPPSPSTHKPSPFLTPYTPQYTPPIGAEYFEDVGSPGSPLSPMNEPAAMREMLDVVKSGAFRAQRKPIILYGHGERKPKFLERWVKRPDLSSVREDQVEPPDSYEYWPGPYNMQDVSPELPQIDDADYYQQAVAAQPEALRAPSPVSPATRRRREIERIAEEMGQYVPLEISPRTPTRTSPMSYEFESPVMSPKLKIPPGGLDVRQEILSVELMESPKTPPRTPTPPRSRTPSPARRLFSSVEGQDALETTPPMLAPSPQRSPLPRTPPAAPAPIPYGALEGPGSPPYSPSRIRTAIETHEYTEHRQDKKRELMKAPLSRSRRPKLHPLAEAAREHSPILPPPRQVKEEIFIPLTPPKHDPYAEVEHIHAVADQQYASLMDSPPPTVKTHASQIYEQYKHIVSDISPQEFEDAFPIMDRAPPTYVDLPPGLMDRRLELHSPPSPPRPVSPRLPYAPRVEEPYASSPPLYGSPESYASPTSPYRETGESDYFTAIDFSAGEIPVSPDIYGGTPELYESPDRSVPSPFLGYTPPPRSPIDSPSFIRRILRHEYTEGFLGSDRPSAQKIVKSGKRAVRLHEKAPAPSLEGVSEHYEDPVLTPPHLKPALYPTAAPSSAERGSPQLPSPVRFEPYQRKRLVQVSPLRSPEQQQRSPKQRRAPRRKLMFDTEDADAFGSAPAGSPTWAEPPTPGRRSPGRTPPRESPTRTPPGFERLVEETEEVVVEDPGTWDPADFDYEVGAPFGGRTSPGLDTSQIGDTSFIEEGMEDFRWMG